MPKTEDEPKIMDEQGFLEQVAKLREALDGKVVTTEGSALTAEVREPDRKQRLHYQLRQARQLRAKMEQAADSAEKMDTREERLEVLTLYTPDINTLVSLTLAARGGYTLDDYEDYNRRYKAGESKAEDEKTKAHSTIVNQLVAMAEERDGPRQWIPAGAETVAPPPPRARKTAAAGVKRPPPTDVPPAARRPSPSAEFDEDPFFVPSSGDEYTPNETVSGASNSLRNKKARSSKRRSVITKRCHDCKSSTSYFRRCHYWFLTGAKCGKTYCSKCLVAKYGCQDVADWDQVTNDPDWQYVLYVCFSLRGCSVELDNSPLCFVITVVHLAWAHVCVSIVSEKESAL